MLEALAGGIPVVAFNAPGGIKELLVNNENGILVESQPNLLIHLYLTDTHFFNRQFRIAL